MVNATLAAALEYAAHGFSVIPFQRARKAPALRGGEIHRFRAQAAPVRRLRRWFAGDRHNVGLLTGSPWRLLVLDVDGEVGLRSVRGLPNPPTPRVLTRRGYHAWFRYDGPPRATRIKALPGIDILVDNWQVLAPPSVHPNGTAYAWQDMLTLTDLLLAPTPAWILDLVQTSAAAAPQDQEGQEILYTLPLLPENSQVFPVVATGVSGRAMWTAGEILELSRKPDVALRCAAVLEHLVGRSFRLDRIGHPFRCILPGHTDRKPSASLWWDQHGGLVYRDWHRKPVRRDHEHEGPADWLTLPELRASLAYGEARWLRGAETWTWQMLLLVEAGVVPPAPVQARPLPPGVRPAVRKVYEGFLRLLACKWLLKPGEPTAFTWRFAAAWCGLSNPDFAGQGLQALMKDGYIRQVGTYKRTALFQLAKEDATHGPRREAR
jgi:hypothetical protein